MTLYLNYLEVHELPGPESVRTLVFAGEALPPDLLRRLRQRWPAVGVENIYGPTEVTVYAAGWTVPAVPAMPTRVLIGSPLPNYQTYVLDEQLQASPVGIAGELYVGGISVAQGYLNQPALTAERFIANPHGPGTIYKTGDLVRWTAGGELDYLGREDFQVKLNGLRIELGDVENQLASLPDVQEALVTLVRVNDTPHLVAYYVGQALPAALQTALQEKLPRYMVPSCFEQLAAMPLNSSGKVDRRRLPPPTLLQRPTDAEEAPATAKEAQIQDLFAGVLRLPAQQLRVNRSFFDLGGNSLQATFLLTQLQKTFGTPLALSDIFLHPTVQKLAALLETQQPTALPIERSTHDGDRLPLLRAQKKLFYLYKVDPQRLDYNLPLVFTVDQVDIARLESAFQVVVEHHEALRVAIREEAGEPYQHIGAAGACALRVIPQAGRAAHDCIADLVQPFDLSLGQPARLGVVCLDDSRYIVVLDIHHIIADGVSLRLILSQLEHHLHGHELPEPAIRFRDFVVWEQTALLGSDHYQLQKQWWLNHLQRPAVSYLLPYDTALSTPHSNTGRQHKVRLDPATTARILQECQSNGTTPYVYLLSAWLVLLAKLSGEENLALGTPVSGRNHPHLDTMVGMFVNTLALRFTVSDELTISQLLASVQQQMLDAFDRPEVHLDELTQELGVKASDLFQLMFTYEDIRSMAKSPQTLIFGLKPEPFVYESQTAKFDLTLTCLRDADGLSLLFDYRQQAYSPATIEVLGGLFEKVLHAFQPDTLLGEIQLNEPEADEEALTEFQFGADFLF